MLFKPSQSDILLSQHNNHRDGNFSNFIENCIICPSLGCQNILEIPVLGCELVLGTTSGETGAVLRDCTCAPHVPASSPNTIHSRSSLGGRREHLWAGSGFQNMPKQPRRPAVYLTCPCHLTYMPGFSAPTQLSNALGVRALITTRGAIALKSHVRNWYGHAIACLIKENTSHNCVQFCVP